MRVFATILAAMIWIGTAEAQTAQSTSTPAPAPFVHVISTQIPGFVDPQGTGIFQRLVSKAALDAGMRLDYTLVPWVRAVKWAETKDEYMILPFSRIPSREHRFQWLAKLTEIENGFVTTTRRIDDLETARGLSEVIVWRGSSQEAFLEEQGFQNLIPVVKANIIFSLLKEGRAAAWFGVLDEAQATIGANDHDVTLVGGASVHTETVWLAASRHFDAAPYAPLFDAIASLRDEGYLAQLRTELLAKSSTDPN